MHVEVISACFLSADQCHTYAGHNISYSPHPKKNCYGCRCVVKIACLRLKLLTVSNVFIMAGWAAYAKHRDIFKSNLAICLKRQVYNSCVLPAMTYGAETWTLTKQAQNKLAAAQTKMERSMLNITYKDRRTNIWVRERTKLIDIIYTVRKMKWSWAGHINRLKRRQGRPAKRWRDDLDKYWSDTIWQRTAQDRIIWRRHAEAFAQPRDTTDA